jgi:pimeloyl-ACP methyl ester carboxylesterase
MIAPVDNPLLHVTAFASAVSLPTAAYRELLGATEEAFGHPMEAFSLSRIPGGWQQPTLLIHDPADPEVPYSQAEAVAAARPNAALVPFDGLGHHRIARDPEVMTAALDFLSGRRIGSEPGDG